MSQSPSSEIQELLQQLDGDRSWLLQQIDGGRWLSLGGPAVVTSDPVRCQEGTERYAKRYRVPKERPDRTVIEISVDQILGYA